MLTLLAYCRVQGGFIPETASHIPFAIEEQEDLYDETGLPMPTELQEQP